jgi:hypothetical protein
MPVTEPDTTAYDGSDSPTVPLTDPHAHPRAKYCPIRGTKVWKLQHAYHVIAASLSPAVLAAQVNEGLLCRHSYIPRSRSHCLCTPHTRVCRLHDLQPTADHGTHIGALASPDGHAHYPAYRHSDNRAFAIAHH